MREQPEPDMHIYHSQGETNVTARGGWRRGIHRGQKLVPLPKDLRKGYRSIIQDFCEKAGELLKGLDKANDFDMMPDWLYDRDKNWRMWYKYKHPLQDPAGGMG